MSDSSVIELNTPSGDILNEQTALRTCLDRWDIQQRQDG